MHRLKKIKSLLFFASAMMLFTACQKEIDFDDTAVINPTVDFKVKTYTQAYTSTTGSFSETYNLSYDANNRLVTRIDTADSSNKFVYTYNANNTYTMDLFLSGVLNIHVDFFLNNIPLIDSTSQYNNTGDTTLEKILYNSANQITQVKDYDYTMATGPLLYGTTDYTYDANGNVIQEADNSAGTVYTYQYSTELNTVDVGLIYESRNKNLTSRTTIVDGGTTVIANHTYTFDSYHRVTSETRQYDNGDTVVNSYTY